MITNSVDDYDADRFAHLFSPSAGDTVEELLAQGFQIDELIEAGLLDVDEPTADVADQNLQGGWQPLTSERIALLESLDPDVIPF